jgi:hypothetical protein
MATSGTIGSTVIDTSAVIEHAYRRIGKPASSQTPEGITIAKECLFLLLTGLASRGFNLWCVERSYMGLTENQAVYTTPVGTIDVMNVVYSQPTRATGTDTVAATSTTTLLTSSTSITRVGVKFSAISATETLVISSSADGITYTTRYSSARTDYTTDTWYWIQIDPTAEAYYWKVSTTAASTASDFYLATNVYDLPVAQWNRDDFMALNDKRRIGRPSTNYLFEKLLTPTITLWPVPNNSYDHLTIMRHRQVMDVGTLVQTLELPQRWVDPIIWQLASKLCFELEGVDPQRIALVVDQADKNLLMAEGDEGDGAPIYLSPNIGVYTQ